MHDFVTFNKIIRRYLQNLAALMKIVENLKVELVNYAIQTNPPQFVQAKDHQALIEFENKALQSGQRYYGAKAPRSFIGDYLNSVAF